MTVSSQTNSVTYAGDGATTEFAVPYYFLADDHLLVISILVSTGAETVLVLNSDYSVAGEGNPAGGEVTTVVPPDIGRNLEIRRVVPLTQETDYVSNDAFPAESHERALDKLTMVDQQQSTDIATLDDKVNNSNAKTLRVPEGVPVIADAATRANMLLGFDGAGDPQPVAAVNGSATDLELRLRDTVDPLNGPAIVGYPLGRAPAVHTNTVLSRLKTGGNAKLKSDFGAKGDGTTIDTAAINSWWDALMDATYKRIAAFSGEPTWMLSKGPLLELEDGVFVYDGTGLNIEGSDSFVMNVAGQTSLSSKFRIVSDAYLFDFDNNPVQSYLARMTVSGGKGAVRYRSKSRAAVGTHLFDDLRLSRYTECGISNNSIDLPYFRVNNSMFYGAVASPTIGVAISGLSAGGYIRGCVFGDNKYHVKLAVGDNSIERNGPATPYNILYNDFYRTGDRAPSESFDVWIEPGQTTNNAGRAICFIANKFGQENLQSNDAHVLIADSTTGTGLNLAGDRQHVTTKSTGFVSGLRFSDNNVNSQNAGVRVPYLRSFTPNLGNLKIDDIFDNAMPSFVVEFLGGIIQTEIGNLAKTNVFDASGCMALQEADAPALLSNLEGVFQVIDPLNTLTGNQQAWNRNAAGQQVSFTSLYSNTTFSGAVANATKVAINNSYGGANEAAEVTLTASDGRMVFTAAGGTAGRQAFVYAEFKRSSTEPLPSVVVDVLNGAGAFIESRRMILLDTLGQWQPALIPVTPNAAGNMVIRVRSNAYSAGVATKFQIGNVKVYHNSAPLNAGHLQALSADWDKQHLVMGAYHLWVDATGDLRIKSGAPATDLDGTVVGTQS